MTAATKGAAPADISCMESVAKALGLRGYVGQDRRGLFFCATVPCKNSSGQKKEIYRWLDDDGDSHRASVRLRITIEYSGCSHSVPSSVTARLLRTRRWGEQPKPWLNVAYVPSEMWENVDRPDDARFADYYLRTYEIPRGIEAAVRRAIFLAAAKIGEAMP